jgi:hypothetical protein
MRIKWVALVLVSAAMVMGLSMVACGGAAPTAAPTEMAAVPTDTGAMPATESPVTVTEPPLPSPLPVTDTPAPLPTDTAEPPTPTAELVSAENCIGCHTDQPTLQAMAVEEEIVSEATSGEG